MDQGKFSVDAYRLWALLLGIQLVAIPLYWRIPVMVTIAVAIFTFGAVMIALGRARYPGKSVRLVLLLLTFAVMVASYGTLLGREAGTGFLILLSFLKLFEISNKRDVYILVYLNYFLIASNFFYTQAPWVVIYVVAVVIYLTSLLILLSDRLSTIKWQQRLWVAVRIMWQAVPLMLIMFLLFPRIPGPLWGLPKDAAVAVTGLSEDMSPGSMSSLIQSDEVAFRVRFDGSPPPHETLYWRGPVFSHYDGRTWTAGLTSKQALPNLQTSTGNNEHVKYTVTLEPHQRDWLFALEYPVQLENSGYRLTREMQLLNKGKVTGVFQYTLSSDSRAINQGLSEHEKKRNLHLPGQLNSQTIGLAKHWLSESNGQAWSVVNKALLYFRNQPFVYTLNPPILGNDAMDDFLFETRRGFCEHYSSAFVYLMRAAGLPARIVTGYQGGDKNPLDNYIIVRQSNAHAWAEVWLEDQGWSRVDPTAAVSPDRIESGIQDAIVERDLLPAILISESAWLRYAGYQWDSFNNVWNEWVVGFDQKRQRQLFRHLGMQQVNWQQLTVWMVIAMFLVGGGIAWWVFRQGTGRRVDATQQAYDRFCKKLAKAAGSHRLMNEGPQEYYARTRKKLAPACAMIADQVIDQYVKTRYGNGDSRQNAKKFLRLVKGFHAKPRKL